MVHSSRNKCQIPWGGWHGHASCHSFQWGRTAIDRNYSETGLHDGWSIILPMGNPHKSEHECVSEARTLNHSICTGRHRNIMLLGRKVSRGKYLSQGWRQVKKKKNNPKAIQVNAHNISSHYRVLVVYFMTNSLSTKKSNNLTSVRNLYVHFMLISPLHNCYSFL